MTKQKHFKGFTLVELLVTISVVAILATVSVVGYVSFIEKAHLSNDRFLIAQLNNHKDAFMVGKGSTVDEETLEDIVNNFLGDAGKSELTLETGDKNKVIFNKETNKFEIVDTDFILDESKHLPVGDFSNTDSGDGEGSSDGSGGSNDEENSESDSDNDIFVPYLKDFVQDEKKSSKKDTYCNATNGIIYIGIYHSYENLPEYNKYLEFNTSSLIIGDTNNPDTIFEIKEVLINNSVINNSFTFYESGSYTMTITFNINENEERSLEIPVICENRCYSDAQLIVNDISESCKLSHNADDEFVFNVILDNIYSNCKVIDFDPNDIIGSEAERDLYSFSHLRDNLSVFVEIDSIIYEITDFSNNQASIEICIDKYSNQGICTIVYNYQGINGITVQQTVPVNIITE